MNNTDRYPLLCGTDTAGGVSNKILKKLVEAGKKKNKPYGDDDFTELAKIEFKNIFRNKNLEIIPMISGTASNAFALSLMTKKMIMLFAIRRPIFLQVNVVRQNFLILGLN